MNSKPSTRKKYKKKGKEIKLTFIILLIGVVIAFTAPFAHMLLPNKSQQMIYLDLEYEKDNISKEIYKKEYDSSKEKFKTFGFNSPRKFAYAIGRSVTIFFMGLFFLFIYRHIIDILLRKTTIIIGFLGTGIGLYFMVWAFWAKGDLSETLYYSSMILVSIFGTLVAYWLTNFRFRLLQRIEKLIQFISIHTYFKYIRKEDQNEYMDDSFSLYDDITKS